MNLNTKPLSFFSVEKKHRNIIRSWLNKEHVQQFFYGQGLENTLKMLDLFVDGINHNDNYCFHLWIAYIENKPFGFLMTSIVEGPYDPEHDYNKWFVEGKEMITLDMLIGEVQFLGKGLAHRMSQEFLLDKFSHASTVLIDPEATNTKAIHVYEKAGFQKVEQFTPKFNPKPHWMMRLEMEDLK